MFETTNGQAIVMILQLYVRYFLLDVFLDSGGWFFYLLTFSEFSGRGFTGRCAAGFFVSFS